MNKWAKIGQPNHVSIVSFDGDEVGMQYLKDGYSEVDAAQSAAGTGEQAIEWAVKLTKGEKPPKPVLRDPGIIVNVENFQQLAPKVWSYGKLK